MEELLNRLREWGLRERAILGIALVDSHARGMARPESDVDLVILLDDPPALASEADWMARFGSVRRVSDEDWGPVKAKRVHYADGKEVRFGFASSAWAATEPCDAGTLGVVENGIRVVYDPKGLFRNLAIAARPDRPGATFSKAPAADTRGGSGSCPGSKTGGTSSRCSSTVSSTFTTWTACP